jgi:type I restriction enzyme, S subunit
MKQGWEIKKLVDICDKASSNVSQNQLTNETGNYPIYGAGGLISVCTKTLYPFKT